MHDNTTHDKPLKDRNPTIYNITVDLLSPLKNDGSGVGFTSIHFVEYEFKTKPIKYYEKEINIALY